MESRYAVYGLDACPSDQANGPPELYHALVMVNNNTADAVFPFWDHLTSSVDGPVGEWKHMTPRLRKRVVDAICQGIEQGVPLFVTNYYAQESSIWALQDRMAIVLGATQHFVTTKINNDRPYVRCGPFAIANRNSANGAEKTFKLHPERAIMCLFTAFVVASERVTITETLRKRGIIGDVHIRFFSDLQACDRIADPWGIQTVAGLLGVRHPAKITFDLTEPSHPTNAFVIMADIFAALFEWLLNDGVVNAQDANKWTINQGELRSHPPHIQRFAELVTRPDVAVWLRLVSVIPSLHQRERAGRNARRV